jgi:anthranilate phosphoribosyltransferase
MNFHRKNTVLVFEKSQEDQYNMSLIPFLDCVVARQNLSSDDAQKAMSVILSGGASTAQIAAFLIALRMKGETSAEVLGFARAMREKAQHVNTATGFDNLLDTCGTGGDGSSTFNISTVTAFVVAGAGAKVAKHGNRSISSQCGSADVFEGLGVNIVLTPEQTAHAIETIGIGFLFAPAFHPAMKHAQPARLELKTRTVFNILGPLTNPAGASTQLVGAPGENAAILMAEALAALDLKKGFVVHGSDGLDEITTTGPTLALEVTNGVVTRRTLTPEDFGVQRVNLEALKGGDRQMNCEIARSILSGAHGPKRDIVLVNSSAALVACGKARDFHEGMILAAESIDSGAALRKADELIRFTRRFGVDPKAAS